MFGLGKRKRELEEAAKLIAQRLLEEAVREDRRHRHSANDDASGAQEYPLALTRWQAEGMAVWQEAKLGKPDAIRQIARNYVFGTGMPVNLQKARMWLEVVRVIEAGEIFHDPPDIDAFWSSLEVELDKTLTDRECTRAKRHAEEWVSGLLRAQKKQLERELGTKLKFR